MPIVLKSGSLNFLGASGPVRDSTEIALVVFLYPQTSSDMQFDSEEINVFRAALKM